MTLGAGVRDFVFIGHDRGDDGKGVGTDVDAGKSGLNFGHMAGNAIASGLSGAVGGAGKIRKSAVVELAGLVMSVGFEGSGMRAVEGHRCVAIEAELIGGLA